VFEKPQTFGRLTIDNAVNPLFHKTDSFIIVDQLVAEFELRQVGII
jgi:hypothetical protein